jgi:histidine triad (HIT) family protein
MSDQTTPGCVFCPVYERPTGGTGGRAPLLTWPLVRADHITIRESSDGLRHAIFTPLEPIVTGHVVIVPETHVPDASANPRVSGGAFEVASAWAASRFDFYNLITNTGRPASQSVFHLHVHVIPRSSHDGLQLPWTGQKR